MSVVKGWVFVRNDSVGYAFREEIKKSLTIVGRLTSSFQANSPVVQLFEEHEDGFYVPRGYFNMRLRPRGVEGFFVPSSGNNALSDVEPIQLRPGQPELVAGVVNECRKNPFGGAIIYATVGGGKSAMALEISRRLGLKTLVLCPTSVLLEQWQKEIAKFFPTWSVGRLQADKIDIHNRDIVVGTIQSAALKEYEDYIYDAFGTIISDECHISSAQEYSNALKKFSSRYLIGATGTLKRADGLDPVFYYSSGPVVEAPKVKNLEPSIYFVDTRFAHVFRASVPLDRQVHGFLEKAIENPARNEIIVRQAEKAALSGRNILILTKRVNHAKLLHSHLSHRLAPHGLTCGMAIGEMKQADREKSYSASVIVATTQLIATGFNEPRLDTLIMATPIAGNTLLQAIGRIRRLHDNKKPPFVLDLVDTRYEGAVISAKSRFSVYLNNEWSVKGYELFDKEYLCSPRVASKISQMNQKRL